MNIRTREGAAKENEDFNYLDQHVAFDHNQNVRYIDVGISDDGLSENIESFMVELYQPIGGSIGGPASANIFIIDDDNDETEFPNTYYSFAKTSIDVLESMGHVDVEIIRNNYLLRATSVVVTTEGIEATGSDYTSVSSRTIQFAPGVSSYTLNIPIIDDSVQEPLERFRVQLSQPSTGSFVDGDEAIVNIYDDDSTILFDADSYDVSEEDEILMLQVLRTGSIDGTASVDFVTSYVTNSSSPDDFVSVSRTLSFSAGQENIRVDVQIRNDEIAEEDEVFMVKLFNPVNGVLGDPYSADVLIIDDDSSDGSGGGDDSSFTTLSIVAIVAGFIAAIAVLASIATACWICTRAVGRSKATFPVVERRAPRATYRGYRGPRGYNVYH
ncbi:extracellular matrix protein 3-like [Amphiura filiformis]|uniref:extracellular matrix protein 3-like n=1 Tax=Amphiura filiformis TaxID=82378 RepID=UPI003B20D1B0